MTDAEVESHLLISIRLKEKLLSKCLDKFTAFSEAAQGSASPEACDMAHAELLKEIDECDLAAARAVISSRICDSDVAFHRNAFAEQEESIGKLEEEIQKLKVDLERAKLEKKQYDEQISIIKKIDNHQTRQQIRDNIAKLEQDRLKAEEACKALTEKLDALTQKTKAFIESTQHYLKESRADLEKDDDTKRSQAKPEAKEDKMQVD